MGLRRAYLIPADCGFRSYLSYKILYDGIFAGKPFFLNLTINALGREWILLKPLDDIFSIVIQFAGLL